MTYSTVFKSVTNTGKTLLLFVHEQNKDENGRTLGFVNFGEVEFLSHKNN